MLYCGRAVIYPVQSTSIDRKKPKIPNCQVWELIDLLNGGHSPIVFACSVSYLRVDDK